jgi:hypothetical protein
MNGDALFLRRCEEIAALQAGAANELDLLDIAAKMRQLLYDQHCLVDAVNDQKINIKFVVCPFGINMPPPKSGIMALGDGLDPETSPPKTPIPLDREQFGSYVVLYLDARPVTIKGIIRYAANVAGGIHFDPKNSKAEYETLKLFEGTITLMGVSPGSIHLRAIARVVLRGLSPLMQTVKARAQ